MLKVHDFRDAPGECAHPFEFTYRTQGRDQHRQVGGDGRLRRE
jgi:hypothetical protein